MVENVNLKETILVDTNNDVHVALSVRGSGILAQAIGAVYDGNLENRRTAIEFSYQVVRVLGLSSADERLPTPQILVDIADVVINNTNVTLTCTTWKWLPEGMEICSIGANTVLVIEGETIRQVIAPHTPYELFKSQGRPTPFRSGNADIPLKALGSKKDTRNSKAEDVRMAVVPLLPTTTIAIIEKAQLVEDIIKEQVPRNGLSSFIDSWDHLEKKVRTSVLISLL